MIGKLKGFIDEISDDKLLLDVNGVCYCVFISNKSASSLRQFPREKQIAIIIETVVKEDAIELYGFVNEIEKIWFAELTKVQGVGNKVAMKILGFFIIEDLAKALISSDVKSFSQISGIGPKLASRIVTELKESPKKLGIDVGFGAALTNFEQSVNSEIVKDCVSALENLGYKKSDSIKIASSILEKNPQITLENLITLSLRELSKRQ